MTDMSDTENASEAAEGTSTPEASAAPTRKRESDRLLMVWRISMHLLTTLLSRLLIDRVAHCHGPLLVDLVSEVLEKAHRSQLRLRRSEPAQQHLIMACKM